MSTDRILQHDRLAVEQRIETSGQSIVKTSDVARLMELFQSSLLHYWEFTLATEEDNVSSEETKVEHAEQTKERSGESERAADRPIKKHREKKVPVIFFDEAHKLYVLAPFLNRVMLTLEQSCIDTVS